MGQTRSGSTPASLFSVKKKGRRKGGVYSAGNPTLSFRLISTPSWQMSTRGSVVLSLPSKSASEGPSPSAGDAAAGLFYVEAAERHENGPKGTVLGIADAYHTCASAPPYTTRAHTTGTSWGQSYLGFFHGGKHQDHKHLKSSIRNELFRALHTLLTRSYCIEGRGQRMRKAMICFHHSGVYIEKI